MALQVSQYGWLNFLKHSALHPLVFVWGSTRITKNKIKKLAPLIGKSKVSFVFLQLYEYTTTLSKGICSSWLPGGWSSLDEEDETVVVVKKACLFKNKNSLHLFYFLRKPKCSPISRHKTCVSITIYFDIFKYTIQLRTKLHQSILIALITKRMAVTAKDRKVRIISCFLSTADSSNHEQIQYSANWREPIIFILTFIRLLAWPDCFST